MRRGGRQRNACARCGHSEPVERDDRNRRPMHARAMAAPAARVPAGCAIVLCMRCRRLGDLHCLRGFARSGHAVDDAERGKRALREHDEREQPHRLHETGAEARNQWHRRRHAGTVTVRARVTQFQRAEPSDAQGHRLAGAPSLRRGALVPRSLLQETAGAQRSACNGSPLMNASRSLFTLSGSV